LSDGTLSAQIVPNERGAALSVSGSRFTLPLGPAYQFESLQLTGNVSRSQLTDVRAEGSIFGGSFKASGQARYANGIHVEGAFDVDHLNLEPLVALFANGVSVTGSAQLKGSFNLRANRLQNLFDHERVEFSFTGNKGVINNVDFMRAAQSPAREGVRGGRTRYTNVSGMVMVADNRASFYQVRVTSDAMTAAGAFDILPKGELSGRMGIQVAPRGTLLAQSNVAVTGDVRNPVLR
jgi:hypothetical protein